MIVIQSLIISLLPEYNYSEFHDEFCSKLIHYNIMFIQLFWVPHYTLQNKTGFLFAAKTAQPAAQ